MIEKVCCIIILFAGEVAIATIINLYKDALSKMEEIKSGNELSLGRLTLYAFMRIEAE